MRLLLKLILIVVIFAVLAHFFGPQMDHLWSQTKSALSHLTTSHQDNHQDDSEKKNTYYKLEKRGA